MTDKIIGSRIEKGVKYMKIFAVLTLCMAILKLLFKPEILSGGGSLIDYLFNLLPLYFYFVYIQKTRKRKGQFIEWKKDSIIYKLHNPESIELKTNDISSINIKISFIEISTTNNKTYILNIGDFTEYKDIRRIKENFTALAENVINRH